MSRSVRSILVVSAVALVVAGAFFDRGNCTRHEELQLFSLGAAMCVAVAIGLGGAWRRWIVGVVTGALIYAALWTQWALTAEHCLN